MSANASALDPMRLALVGVPNSGKTALFNRLTGSRQKVANYAGVTVERKEGSFVGPSRRRQYRVLDLPGSYSLTPTTLDEAITRDFLLGRLAGEAAPEFVVCVVDATNLKLNLRLALELRDLGVPMVVALNMSDLARVRGFQIDRARLEKELGVPVVEPSRSSTAGTGSSSRLSSTCNIRARRRRVMARSELRPSSRPSAKCAASCAPSTTRSRRAAQLCSVSTRSS